MENSRVNAVVSTIPAPFKKVSLSAEAHPVISRHDILRSSCKLANVVADLLRRCVMANPRTGNP